MSEVVGDKVVKLLKKTREQFEFKIDCHPGGYD